MLNKILSISLQNRLMVLLGAVVLSVAGLYIARNMNVDVFPDLTAPTVTLLDRSAWYGVRRSGKTGDLPVGNSHEWFA